MITKCNKIGTWVEADGPILKELTTLISGLPSTQHIRTKIMQNKLVASNQNSNNLVRIQGKKKKNSNFFEVYGTINDLEGKIAFSVCMQMNVTNISDVQLAMLQSMQDGHIYMVT